MEVYFDNSATTALCERAVNEMTIMLKENFGNPSSLHYVGINALNALNTARERLARSLSCESEEIYFTSGGTQSNNIAVLGAANALRRRGNKIVTTSIEHPSVEECMKSLEKKGFEVVRLSPGAGGKISIEQLQHAIDEKTVLVSVMKVNNELGSIQPVESIKNIVKKAKSPALIHTDCVQAFGKIPVNPSKTGVDLLSVSSHKIHGPKGAGALYVRKGVKLLPEIYGGGQEKSICPGTQAMPAIVGLGAAVEDFPNLADCGKKISELRDYLIYNVKRLGGIEINSPEDALPYIINISVLGLRSENMLNFLSARGICVSSGSACAKGKKSKILTNFGLSGQRVDSALRISLSRYTTRAELDYLIEGIKGCKREIRAAK